MLEGSSQAAGSESPFIRAAPDKLKGVDELSISEESTDDSILDQLTDMQKIELFNQVERQWNVSNASRVKWMNDRQEGLQLYWGIRRPKDFPFRNAANVHVPMIRTIMDTLHANIMSSIDLLVPARAVPVGQEDVSKARKIEKLLNWQFQTQIDYSDLADKAINSALLYGIAPVKLRYVIERENGKKTYDGLKAEVLAPERFLTPPDASDSDVDKMDYVIHEITMSKSDLKKRMGPDGPYRRLPDEELERTGENITRQRRQFDDFLESIRSIYSGVESLNTTNPEKKYSTVLEYYGNYDYNGDGIEEPIMCSVLKDSKKLLRAVKWRRPRPFVILIWSYILSRALGESVPEVLKILNQELNTLHNLNLDALVLSNMPFFFFDPVAGYTPDEIHLAPGVGIPTNGPPQQAIYFPQMNTKFNEMSRAEQDLVSYAERMLGAGANVQGIIQPKRITATEIQTIDRRSGIRFLTLFNRVRQGLKQIFKLALSYDKEYMPKEIQVRITGLDAQSPVFETINRSDLEAEVDILINGNSVLDYQSDQQEMIQAYQIGMQNPMIARNENAVYELTKDLLTALGVKRIDAYLHKPEDQLPKTPAEEHNLFMQEENAEPHLGEDVSEHLKAHAELINSKNFSLMPKQGQLLLMKHYHATLKMQGLMEQMQMVGKLQQVNSEIMQLHMGTHPIQQMATNGTQNGAPATTNGVAQGAAQ